MATSASLSGIGKRAASQEPDDRASKKAREDLTSNHAIAGPETDATDSDTRDQSSADAETTPAGTELAPPSESSKAPIEINEDDTEQQQKEEILMRLSDDGEAYVSYSRKLTKNEKNNLEASKAMDAEAAAGFLNVTILDAGREKAARELGFSHCLLYTSPSPRDGLLSRMPSSA